MKRKRRQERRGGEKATIGTILREHRRSVVYLGFLLAMVLVLVVVTVGGGSSDEVKTGDFFEKLKDAPTEVREAYLYALERPDVLQYIPCFCGCDKVGHRSSLDCFVAGTGRDGQPIFADHGYG
ncbi:MAG: PCYCGC motif-containing (lipo)protein [Dehalococcoidia bacterium]